jgi:hypothetical protein
MNRRRLALSIGLGALLAGRLAMAQDVTIGYQGLPYKSSGESATGFQIADGLLLHAGIGVEAGYDTNVFYSQTNAVGSSIFRVLPFVELTNASRTGPASQEVSFDARAGLQYRRYGSSQISSAYSDAWNPNAGLTVNFGGAQFGFGFGDTFARIEDAPYAPNGNTIINTPGALGAAPIERDNNQASVEARWSPGGGRLTASLRYTNMIDFYQGAYAYANDVTNTLMLDVAWKWLPKTAIFLDVQQGYIFYTDTTAADLNKKSSSFPLVVTTGLRGLLTEKTSAALSLGYVNAFYSNGASTTGFLGSTYASLALTVNLTQLSRLVLGARHDFLNSVISNFEYEESVYASYVQQLGGRLALDLSTRYSYLSYEGQTFDVTQEGRVDNTVQVGASLDYFLRSWAYLGVGYSLMDNSSNIPGDSYVKQQVFARLGGTY